MSQRILVSGLINVETTLGIEGFPLEYFPVNFAFDRIHSSVSGVGYNVAKALHTLGHPVSMMSLIGEDDNGKRVTGELQRLGIDNQGVLKSLTETPVSVILYEPSGRRQIHVDLKSIQDALFDQQTFQQQLAQSQLAVMCNINFNRPLLPLAKSANVPVATDVHTLSDPDDDYNRDFMAAADILFVSDEGLNGRDPHEFIHALHHRYRNRVIVMGRGREGALMYVAEDDRFYHAAAVQTREVVNTIGAGDALFSAFIHAFSEGETPYRALELAVRFASWKIGATGAADGFLNAEQLAQLAHQYPC